MFERPAIAVTTVNDTVCYGESYLWSVNGQSYTGTTTDTIILQNVYGCDSVVVLELFERPTVAVTTVYDTICHGNTYVWSADGLTYSGTTTASVTLPNVYGCDSVVILELFERPEVTLPVVTVDDIIAICGKAVDVSVADAIVRTHMTTDPLFPTLEDVVWETLNADGTWSPLTNTAIDGLVSTVTLRYTIQTECDDVLSESITVEVATPTYENSPEMDEIGLVSRYGDRILTVDLKHVQDVFGWEVAETDVTWFKDGVEIPGAHGYYLTTEDGIPLAAGEYSARIIHKRTEPSDCDGELRTMTHEVIAPDNGPKLAPSVAHPQELIRILNLDPEMIVTVNVYSTTGEMITSFQVNKQETASFNAAPNAGFYVVELQTETEKVSLRYIVK